MKSTSEMLRADEAGADAPGASADEAAVAGAEEVARQLATDKRMLSESLAAIDRSCTRLRHAVYEAHLSPVIERLRQADVGSVVIYGAGEVGQILAAMCRSAGIAVHGFVQSARRDAVSVEGIAVRSPQESAAGRCHDYAIGSFGSAAEMLRELAAAYGARQATYRAFVAPAAPSPVPTVQSLGSALGRYRELLDERRTLADLSWLEANAAERMDAYVSIFKPSRRDFHLARYRFAAQHVGGARVLDCASGTGYGSALLIESGGARSVLGVDCAASAIGYARRYYPDPRASWRCLPADAVVTLPGRFDVITSFETIEHVADDGAVLDAFAKVLDDSGVCIVSTPDAWPVSASPHHVRSYDRATFARRLQQYFREVTLFGQWSSDFAEPAGLLPLADCRGSRTECLIAVCRRPIGRRTGEAP